MRKLLLLLLFTTSLYTNAQCACEYDLGKSKSLYTNSDKFTVMEDRGTTIVGLLRDGDLQTVEVKLYKGTVFMIDVYMSGDEFSDLRSKFKGFDLRDRILTKDGYLYSKRGSVEIYGKNKTFNNIFNDAYDIYSVNGSLRMENGRAIARIFGIR